MIYLELFWSFLMIGFTSFGGVSMIPFISSEMVSHGWMTAAEVSDIVAIAEMTPGPLGLNSATFAGTRVAGFAGSLCASLGVLFPSLTVGILAAVFLEKMKHNTKLEAAMYGVRPICIGLITYTVLSIGASNYTINGEPFWPSLLIGAVICLVMWKWKPGVPVVILLAAFLGILIVR